MYGREPEQARLAAFVHDVRQGWAASLVLRGAPGIGKTTLLDDVAEHAEGFDVLRVSGVETETELPHAALQLLTRPIIDRLDALPPVQRDALRVALGLAAGAANRFQVGLAVLGLLAEHGPLLCLVDDAQWLDRESVDALLFAVRRLHAEPVGVIFATRDEGSTLVEGLEVMPLEGIPPDAAGRLLTEHADGLALEVRDQLIREAEGNPLALLELPRSLTPEQRAGGFAPLTPAFVEPGALPSRVLRGFRNRIEALPDRARRCLLLIALAGDGDLPTIVTAGGSLDELAVLERAKLARIRDGEAALWHPLVRVAAQLSADVKERAEAHQALAQAAGGDRAVLHRAAATTGIDDALAGELDEVAQRSAERGALSVASATAERAAALGADPGDRFRRLAYAATAALEAGQLKRAEQLVRRAGRRDEHPGPSRQLAGVRALLEFECGVPSAAARILVDDALPASTPEYVDLVLARAAVYTWSSANDPEQHRLFEALGQQSTGPVAGLVEGLRLAATGQPAAAVPALTAYAEAADGKSFPERLAAAHAGLLIGDHHRVRDLAAGLVADCYREGRAMILPQPLGLLAIVHLLLGETGDATAARAEAWRTAVDTGQQHRASHLLGVAAWIDAVAGDHERARQTADETLAAAVRRERVAGIGWAVHALTVLDLQQGDYERALRRLEQASSGVAAHSISVQLHALPDLVEAAVRAGARDHAVAAAERFAAWAEATRRPWALAVASRCAALTAEDAERHYERSLALHATDRHPLEYGRTQLLYGEWLRRRQRRSEAAVHLETARETFVRIGARGWEDRVAAELRAAGYAGAREDNPLSQLTAQEHRVVRLAAGGLSNRDIASQLFLSPRTVGYHLYKAYPKLGITSRSELATLLKQAGRTT